MSPNSSNISNLLQRIAVVGGVILATTSVDMTTKRWAEDNLATRTTEFTHYVKVRTPNHPVVLSEFIDEYFESDPVTQRLHILNSVQRFDSKSISPQATLEPNTMLLISDRTIDVVPGWITLRYTRNNGNALGLIDSFEDQRTSLESGTVSRANRRLLLSIAIAVFTLLISAGMFYTTLPARTKDDNATNIKGPYSRKLYVVFDVGIGLFAGGGIANAIDRIYTGYVIDFIDLPAVGFPTFNLADLSLSVGFVISVASGFFLLDSDKRVTSEATDDEISQK